MDKNVLHEMIRGFLHEDVGRGDLTSEAVFFQGETGTAQFVARQRCVVAGMASVAAEVFTVQNPAIVTTGHAVDGTVAEKGMVLLQISGPVVDMLKAERVALNLVQRLCGIATLTRTYVDKVEGTRVKISDTRKTTPGLRLLEKYAVRVGGGANHRYNLTDGVMIKDNHIAACGSISDAVMRVRSEIPHTVRIEVETDTIEQVEECLECGVDIIMLDNMSLELLKEAVKLIDGRALVEASGGVNLGSVEAIAKTGVDIISVGALTHSAMSCDIGMDWSL